MNGSRSGIVLLRIRRGIGVRAATIRRHISWTTIKTFKTNLIAYLYWYHWVNTWRSERVLEFNFHKKKIIWSIGNKRNLNKPWTQHASLVNRPFIPAKLADLQTEIIKNFSELMSRYIVCIPITTEHEILDWLYPERKWGAHVSRASWTKIKGSTFRLISTTLWLVKTIGQYTRQKCK